MPRDSGRLIGISILVIEICVMESWPIFIINYYIMVLHSDMVLHSVGTIVIIH